MSHTETEDILWGADAIAKAINRSRRETFYLLEKKAIPARKVGGRYAASRQALIAFLCDAPEFESEQRV